MRHPWATDGRSAGTVRFSKSLGSRFLSYFTDTGQENYISLRNMELNKEPSVNDMRHVRNACFSYDLPFGRGQRFDLSNSILDNVIGGWNIGGIFTFHSGIPFWMQGGYNSFNDEDGGIVLNGVSYHQVQRATSACTPRTTRLIWFTDRTEVSIPTRFSRSRRRESSATWCFSMGRSSSYRRRQVEMNPRLRWWILLGTLFVLLPLPVLAQGTLADYQRAEQFLPGNLQKTLYIASVYPNWIEKSDRFWYVKMGPGGKQFILVDATQNTTGPAFDQARLAAALSRATGKPYRAGELPFFSFEYVQNAKAIRFAIDRQQWSCTLADYECKRTSSEAGTQPYESLSPNGAWAAFVRDHNLFARHVPTGTVMQLTRDGVPGWDYAKPLPDLRTLVSEDVSNGDDVKRQPAVFWSPDSTKLVTYRLDSRNAGRFTSLQYVPSNQLRPMAYNYVYPLPGEVLPQAAPVIFDLESGKRIDVKTSPLEIQFIGGPGFRWFPDSRRFYYRYDERGEKATELREVDAEAGEQKVLIREVAKPYPYVDPGETFSQFFDDDKQILWSSERDGWDQLYAYNASTGQLENQVTRGSWVVREIKRVDAKRGYVYFLASGVQPKLDPYYTQLYRVKLDGSGMELLTPEDADHTVSISPDGDYFIDNYSRPDSAGESVLRRASDGSGVRVLERTDDAALVKMGWKAPIPFEGKAADGKTDLYGIIVRPTNFDPAKKYPILENIYTGPQGFFVPKTFGAAMRLESMAELGFVVVMVDGRGSTGRSREFHDFSYHDMGNVFIDHVAMIKQMAAKYPWMDINRVGIFGTSAGGYGSAHAFLQFPDFYKVCVSTSGDHDPRLDKAWWNELYQGYPVGKDYAEQANQALAANLQGHLLLIHGDIDDNVNPTETMHLVDALMSANKNFDMLFVPNMFHGDSGPHAHYVTRRRWDYFVRYLLGVAPPKNFEIHEAPFFFAFRRR